MFGFFKKLFDQRDDSDVGINPSFHSFPNVGTDGEVTVDCIIRPTTGADRKNALRDKQANDWRAGVASKRVGTLEVEVDEYGLRFRWQPGEVGDDSFRFPALTAQRMKPATDPTEQRGDDGHVKPLEDGEVKVHANEVPNFVLGRQCCRVTLRLLHNIASLVSTSTALLLAIQGI